METKTAAAGMGVGRQLLKDPTTTPRPVAVNRRRDQLHELAINAGTHVSRAQLLAALVMAIERDGERDRRTGPALPATGE
jgi:hypothetical protein